MINFNPLFAYTAAGALAFGAVAGYTVRGWKCDAAVAKALEKAAETRQEMQHEVDRQATAYEAARDQAYGMGSEITREIRTIYKDRPSLPADCSLDAGVVGLLEGGVRSANAAASGESGE